MGGLFFIVYRRKAMFQLDTTARFLAVTYPLGGDLDAPGTVYLVVDTNGLAGYQPGADLVLRLEHASGTLTPDDFL